MKKILFGKDKATNADIIRDMTDEEMARELIYIFEDDFDLYVGGIRGGTYETIGEAVRANLKWLQQPAKNK